MSGVSVAPLLLQVRDAGLRLEVEGDALAVSPSDKLTSELREQLLRHKPELLKALTWRESEAHKLLKDATAHLAEFFIGTGLQTGDLMVPDPFEDRIDAAMVARDMFGLRIAVREWVEAGRREFDSKQTRRGTAA